MAEPIAVNGLVFYATDVAVSAALYQKLGFQLLDQGKGYANLILGHVLVNFQDKHNPTDPSFVAEAMSEPKGKGLFIYVQVDRVDEYYREIQARGVTPTTAPRDWPSGNREFVVIDPDGYKLVFYEAQGGQQNKGV